MQLNYSEKCTFGGLKGQSLNTGGLDRFDCVVSEMSETLTKLHFEDMVSLNIIFHHCHSLHDSSKLQCLLCHFYICHGFFVHFQNVCVSKEWAQTVVANALFFFALGSPEKASKNE